MSLTKQQEAVYRAVYHGLVDDDWGTFDVCQDGSRTWVVQSGADSANAVLCNVNLSDFSPDEPTLQVTEDEFIRMIDNCGLAEEI